MESTTSAKAPTTIDVSEVMAVYFASPPEGQQIDDAKLKFEESPTGLVALSKSAFNKIVAERDNFLAQLKKADKTIAKLRKEVNTPVPSINADIAEQNREIIRLNQERRKMSDRLTAAETESKSSAEQEAKFKAEAQSYRKDYNELIADYYHIEDQYYRLHNLLKSSIKEVFRAMTELREPRLRPKAPDGCLNCGVSGHSYRSCAKEYTGLFCQICSHPDFSTDDCPWPHYSELPKQLPDHKRCKCC
ncbi:uncharacterized protein LOC122499026 [Leptopilina heterotoma]|uniref:uncharacterized protein LOC122499026 n=1 Tax=Leptopilina heterotoma TaxID=63436 RepID=UPI001CA8ED27|nr:uncharacterized protein LOC122499026 [Leptopilina heterotoma]